MAARVRFPCDLPPDPLGWVASPHYRSPLRAGRDHKFSTGGSYESPCLERSLEGLSPLEKEFFAICHLNPRILDIREQVPMCTVAEYEALSATYPQGIPRNKIAFLDAILTMDRPEALGYVVINVKPRSRVGNTKELRRMLREREFCEQHGMDWFLVTRDQLPPAPVEGGRLLLNWLKRRTFPIAHTERVAEYMRKSNHPALRDALAAASRALGITKDEAVEAFAAAVLEGLLPLDWRHALGMTKPLRVLAC